MTRVLVAELKQETATFNPVETRYDDFQVHSDQQMLDVLRDTRTEMAGAMQIFAGHGGIQLLPTMAGWAVSGGPIVFKDLDRLINQIVQAARKFDNVDGLYISLHGAMACPDEPDPEGWLLAELRGIFGDVPIVASLDLHAVLTSRMVKAADVLVPFHTYPHIDQYETGQRAARVLLKLLEGSAKPVTARVEMPMLVRGDELITATGLFGKAIDDCKRIEASEGGLAAGVLIGNPFTDVPALQSNVLVTTDGDPDRAQREAEGLARYMWTHRKRLVAPLTSLDESIRQAEATDGLTVFSDAADATASGAPGDSNAILKGLLHNKYSGSALLTIVDAPAATKAHKAGVGATIDVSLGGQLDRGRHTPVEVTAYVKSLSDGNFKYESGTTGRGGRTAVLVIGKIHVVVTERSIYVVGRRVFQAQGLEPQDFDLIVAKSPNGFRTHYQSIAALIVPVDVPGATSANLRSLPYQHCVRPIFPLDENVTPPFSVAP